jgi:hypothetical protein
VGGRGRGKAGLGVALDGSCIGLGGRARVALHRPPAIGAAIVGGQVVDKDAARQQRGEAQRVEEAEVARSWWPATESAQQARLATPRQWQATKKASAPPSPPAVPRPTAAAVPRSPASSFRRSPSRQPSRTVMSTASRTRCETHAPTLHCCRCRILLVIVPFMSTHSRISSLVASVLASLVSGLVAHVSSIFSGVSSWHPLRAFLRVLGIFTMAQPAFRREFPSWRSGAWEKSRALFFASTVSSDLYTAGCRELEIRHKAGGGVQRGSRLLALWPRVEVRHVVVCSHGCCEGEKSWWHGERGAHACASLITVGVLDVSAKPSGSERARGLPVAHRACSHS